MSPVSRSDAPDLVDDIAADDDADLKAVLQKSMEEQKKVELLIKMEEEVLEKILRLSMLEK